MNTGLIRYDAMCHAIAECLSIDDAKEIRDKAKALEVYAKQAMNVEAERKASQIRIRAERRAGELLKEMHLNGGDRKSVSAKSRVKLEDVGINFNQSSEWQQLAEVPLEDFEEAINKPGPPVSTRALIIAHQEKTTGHSDYRPPIDPLDDDAIPIWHLLTDIEPRLSQKTFRTILDTMSDDMRKDVLRIAPQFAAWLSQKEKTNETSRFPCKVNRHRQDRIRKVERR